MARHFNYNFKYNSKNGYLWKIAHRSNFYCLFKMRFFTGYMHLLKNHYDKKNLNFFIMDF